jgi:hypothetical protein
MSIETRVGVDDVFEEQRRGRLIKSMRLFDLLEKIFGLDHDFTGTWGVGRGRFEALTLGTIAVIVAATSTSVRRRSHQ